MGTQTPNPGGQPKQTPPQPPTDRSKGTDQDREEEQEIPKTGRDPSEPIEQQVSNDIPTDDDDDANDDDADDDDADDDEDLTGTIELPGEGGEGEGDRRDASRPPRNP